MLGMVKIAPKAKEEDSVIKRIHINPKMEGLKDAAKVGAGSAALLAALYGGLYALSNYSPTIELNTLLHLTNPFNLLSPEKYVATFMEAWNAGDSLATKLPVLFASAPTIIVVWVAGMIASYVGGVKRAKEEIELYRRAGYIVETGRKGSKEG